MKNLKQIREESEIITEKDASEDKKIATLVRAGLLDTNKLSLVKRALDKDNTKVSPSERKVLLDLLDSLMTQVLNNKLVYQKVRQNLQSKESLNESKNNDSSTVPNILILQRKSVRQFQDGIVALYWARKIDKFVSIPFMKPNIPVVTAEAANIDTLKTLSECQSESIITFDDGNKYKVNSSVAKKIVNVYESMNKKNKKKMEKMLSESVDSFSKVMNFAIKQ